MDARPCEEIWIVAPADGSRIWGEALIGLVYRDSAGRRAEVRVADPRPGVLIEYRPIQDRKRAAG